MAVLYELPGRHAGRKAGQCESPRLCSEFKGAHGPALLERERAGSTRRGQVPAEVPLPYQAGTFSKRIRTLWGRGKNRPRRWGPIEKWSCVYWNLPLTSPRAALSNPHCHSLTRPKVIGCFQETELGTKPKFKDIAGRVFNLNLVGAIM